MFGAESGALLFCPGIWGICVVIGLAGYTCSFFFFIPADFVGIEKSGVRRAKACASDDKIWHIMERGEKNTGKSWERRRDEERCRC